MRMISMCFWAAMSAGLAAGVLKPSDARAQVQYGPWFQTNDCRPLSPPVGAFRGGVRLPSAPGAKQAQECRWQRSIEDCPRVRDLLRHPIRCTTRRQQSGYSQYPPRD
jgi:hypothetical protein